MQYKIDRLGQAVVEKTMDAMAPVLMTRFGLEAIAEAFSIFRDFQVGAPLDVDCLPPPSQGYALLKREGSDGVVIVFA